MDEKVKKQLMDDLLIFGECVTKTEIIDGKVIVSRVEPDDPTLLELVGQDK